MKNCVIFIWFICYLLVGLPSQAHSNSVIAVSVPDTSAPYNTSLQIPVRVGETTGSGIMAIEFSLAFDSSIISGITTHLAGSMVETGWLAEKNTKAGIAGRDTLKVSMATAQNALTGSGDLIYLWVNVADVRMPASTELDLAYFLLNDGMPLANTQNGTFQTLGTDAMVSTDADTVTVGQSFAISVVDLDWNRDDGLAETILVRAYNTKCIDSEMVLLQETSPTSGEFAGSIGTVFGDDGTVNDGELTVASGDRIGIAYIDSFNATGGISLITMYMDVIGGTDGTLMASRVVQALDASGGRDTLRILVEDADLNRRPSQIDTAVVEIRSLLSNEIEVLKAVETDINTGIFRARLPTVSGGDVIDNDGVMTLVPWDTILVSYTDSLTVPGDVKTLQDTIHVVNFFGDLSGNNSVGALDASMILQISVGLINPSSRDSLVGDVDGNLKIQAYDASQVLQYSVGLIDRFAVQTRVGGEMDPKNHPFLKPALASNLVALGILHQHSDDIFSLPIHIEEREGVVSGMLKIGYETEIDVINIEMMKGYESFLTAYRADPKDMRISFAGSVASAKGTGMVAQIYFRAEPGMSYQFEIKEAVLNGRLVNYELDYSEGMSALDLPKVYELYQNVPNPFNPTTSIRYVLPEEARVKLVVYNVMGQQIRSLVSQKQDAGIYFVVWDSKDDYGRKVASGVYLLRLNAESFLRTRKMMLIR